MVLFLFYFTKGTVKAFLDLTLGFSVKISLYFLKVGKATVLCSVV